MATPRPDAYSAASGAAVAAGITVPVDDVVAGVWTPTKNGSGNIRDASWAGLPLNSWVKVSGTAVRQLQNVLDAAGFGETATPRRTFGVDKSVLSTLNAWVGQALDEATGRAYYPWGGGHADSSLNGIWRLDIERMGGGAGWNVVQLPSDPFEPGFEWSADYLANSVGTFTQYTPEVFPAETVGGNRDILPNARPTSRHTYNGVWFDPVRNTINQFRGRKWTYNLTTGATSRAIWTDGGAPRVATINANVFYDAARDELVGHVPATDYDAWSWGYAPAGGTEVVSIGSPVSMEGGHSADRISSTEILVVSQTSASVESWGIYNTVTRTWSSGAIPGPSPAPDTYLNEMQVLCYVPDWGKALRRYTWSALAGAWSLFDLPTKTRETYTPAGNPPPAAPFPGGKCFYYAPRKCVVYVAPTSIDADAVYVMRTG